MTVPPSLTRQDALSGDSGAWAITAGQRRIAAIVVGIAGLLLILITLRPFGVPADAAAQLEDGDPINQFGFLAAGAVAAISLATLADTRILRRALSPPWLAVVAILLISIAVTPAPQETMRSVLLTVIAMTVAVTVLVVAPSERDFRIAFSTAALIVLALAYGSVLLTPALAVHQPGELEAQHAGLWRGHYTHKNLAGPIMSVLALYGFYCWRSGDKFAGAAIAVLATLFVVQTGSKTTLGFLPIAIGIVALRPLFGSSALVVLAHLAVLAAAFVTTVGTVLIPPVAAFIGETISDPTYTGRTAIWAYGFDAIGSHPLFGHGFYNFWLTPTVTDQEANFEENWDIRGVVSGHSNYVDMPLLFGWIGAIVVFWALLVAPMADYVRATRRAENRRLADFFMTVVIFMSLLSLMETFFFNRTDSFWLLVVIAVFGLRLLSRSKLRPA